MRDLTISKNQMMNAVQEIFAGTRKKQPLRRVLYSIYVHQAILEGRLQADQGQTISHEKVMEGMWKQINTGLSGLSQRNGNFKKSSRKS